MSTANNYIHPQLPSYLITNWGANFYANPRPGSGFRQFSGTDAYTVIQAAINALTPSGAAQTGGGDIYIEAGTYTLSNELTIIGWEPAGQNFSALRIRGAGYSTIIRQTTSAKSAIVVKNRANVIFEDFYISVSTISVSGISLVGTGVTSERSINKGYINGVWINSTGTGAAFQATNFNNLNVEHLICESTTNWAVVLENSSTTTNYGNSNFVHLVANGETATFGGIKIIGDNAAHPIQLMNFDYLQVSTGRYGLYLQNTFGISIGFADLEANNVCVNMDGASGKEVVATDIWNGFFSPNTGQTAILASNFADGNVINGYVNADSTAIPVNDLQSGRAGNEYSLIYSSNVTPGNAVITTPSNTRLRVRRKVDGVTTDNMLDLKAALLSPTFSGTPSLPTGTTGITQTAFDNTTKLATTAYADNAGNIIFTAAKTSSYTLVLADRGVGIVMNVATANTLTVPLNATVAFPVNTTQIVVYNIGAGTTTITPATVGVTITGNVTVPQFSSKLLVKIATDTWYAI